MMTPPNKDTAQGTGGRTGPNDQVLARQPFCLIIRQVLFKSEWHALSYSYLITTHEDKYQSHCIATIVSVGTYPHLY